MRPATCWAFPPPWEIDTSALPGRASSGTKPDRECREAQPPQARVTSAAVMLNRRRSDSISARLRATVDRDRREALLLLLERDLNHGNKYVAARHLMMLDALSLPVPPTLRKQCDALIDTCSNRRLSTIAGQVEAWQADLVERL